ncbi:MAG: class I SAM-dependent methyltransferase [Candidatus Latescibacteria bacterium]|jgi:SAM-dependent methyltransferase|nr:class I SAM-dependent methyltransferase [Candidatus Latescibacterota bacterium]
MDLPWYETYFGEDYLRGDRHEDTSLEIDGLMTLLGPADGRLVLDLGCGYGRHGLSLVQNGYRVVGLDLSLPLLRRASTGGLTCVRADMRSVPFLGGFHGVVSMFNAFGYFEDESENFVALQEIEAVLQPGGRLIMQLVNRDYLVRTFVEEEIRREDGLMILEEREFDVVSSRVMTTTTVIDGVDQRVYHSSIRVYSLSELDMLLSASGLRIIEVYGGLDQRLFDWNTNQLVVVAEKR